MQRAAVCVGHLHIQYAVTIIQVCRLVNKFFTCLALFLLTASLATSRRLERDTVPKGFSATLNLKPLPKQEYQLMKAMVAHYNLDGPGELFAVLLRLGYEVMHQSDGQGQAVLATLVNNIRSEPSEVDHQYTLPCKLPQRV